LSIKSDIGIGLRPHRHTRKASYCFASVGKNVSKSNTSTNWKL
jgi:hypothetical protein